MPSDRRTIGSCFLGGAVTIVMQRPFLVEMFAYLLVVVGVLLLTRDAK